MVTKPKPKPDDPEQFARFKKAAKEAGLDETTERFDAAFKKIVPAKRAPTR
jgi:hypothetical protein